MSFAGAYCAVLCYCQHKRSRCGAARLADAPTDIMQTNGGNSVGLNVAPTLPLRRRPSKNEISNSHDVVNDACTVSTPVVHSVVVEPTKEVRSVSRMDRLDDDDVERCN